jgi:hypothetical protein
MNLSQMSDEELTDLSFAISEERHSRVVRQIEQGQWPEPDFLNNGYSHVEDIKRYREQYNCPLTTAKYVVDYYRQKEYLESVHVG